jgi:hypothetical protein
VTAVEAPALVDQSLHAAPGVLSPLMPVVGQR